MKRQAKIDYIYFDLGGVVVSWKDALRSLAKETNLEYEVIYNFFVKEDDLRCKGKKQLEHFWQDLKKEFKIKKNGIVDVNSFFAQNFTPIKETHKLIQEIQYEYKISILSNISKGLYSLLLKQKKIPSLTYHSVIESCNIGLVKPEPEIYHHAQKIAGVKAENILFIDDNRDNIKTAQVLGWQTVLFNENKPSESIKEIRRKI